MKCIGEKDLILFYYGELENDKLILIERHLKECEKCSQEYGRIKSLFAWVKPQTVKLNSADYNKIIEAVKGKVYKTSFWFSLKEKLVDFWDNLRLGLSYRPQLVPIIVILIILSVTVPLIISKKTAVSDRNIDILQIEMELSLDSDDLSIFDFYEEDDSLIEEMSDSLDSTRHNNMGEVHIKT